MTIDKCSNSLISLIEKLPDIVLLPWHFNCEKAYPSRLYGKREIFW